MGVILKLTSSYYVQSKLYLSLSCKAKGGQHIGCETKTGDACSMPTKDGGKPCFDSSECEQECVAPPNCKNGETDVQGTCAERTHLTCGGVRSVKNSKCEAIMIN